MTANIQPAITRGLAQFRTREPLTGAEWADRFFYLSPESSGIEGKWSTYPYQIAPINWMTDSDIEEVNWEKSARVGYTKCLLIAVGYGIEQKRRNIVIWQPTDGDAQGFVSDEVDTMLRDVSVVGELLKCEVGAKSKFNTNEKKSFVGATLDIKGGKSGRNYRRMTKDIAIYDETDGFDRDIDGEGSPFKLGDMRITNSSFPKSIRGSTPKIKGLSLIEAAVNECKYIFYRYLPCPQCGTMQRLEFSRLRVKEDEIGKYICLNGCIIDYADYPEMDAKGRWQTVDGVYYDDATDVFFGPDDEPLVDRPKKIGLKIWAAYSYFRSWSWIAEQWQSANESLKTGDNLPLKTFVNTILGETWEEKGESVESTALSERLEPYDTDNLPLGVLLITAGADVQGGKNPRIEVEILGHGLEGETWSIDYVVIPGDPEQGSVWDHLDDELKRKFHRADGLQMEISGAFIDSGYLPSRVYRFTGPRRGRNIYATKGVTNGMICNKGSWVGEKVARVILHTVNVDEAKQLTFTRLKKVREHGPGYCHFPAHYEQAYFDMLTNEEKREKKSAGRLVGYEWVKKHTHIGNEPLDCRSYNLGCLARLNPNMPALKARLEAIADMISRGKPQPEMTRRSGRRVRHNGVA